MEKKVNALLREAKVRELLINTAGENAIAVIRELVKHGSDEEIAKKLGVRVSDVRAVLNKLHEAGFVAYERTRDKETGWYYYNWILNLEKMKKWVEERLNMNKKKYLELISGGEKYFCPKCGIEVVYSFEEAMDISFKCPNCNSTLELLDEEAAQRLLQIEKLS